MKKKTYTHQDPTRLPHLFDPIEKSAIDVHQKGITQILIGVTKVLVNQHKNVHNERDTASD